jgi:hypothetical protein
MTVFLFYWGQALTFEDKYKIYSIVNKINCQISMSGPGVKILPEFDGALKAYLMVYKYLNA